MKHFLSIITNLSYIIAGVAVWSNAWYVGLSLVLLGLASGWYHYAHTRISNAADIIGIYLTLNACIIYMLAGYGVPLEYLLVGGLAVTGVMATYESKIDSMLVIPTQFLVLALLSLDQVPNYVPIFIAALLLNIPHLRMHGKAPHFFIEFTHGVWHILTAIGFYLLVS